MATHTTLTSLFDAIANKIRSYTETAEKIIADNFPSAIDDVYNKGFTDGVNSSGEVATDFTDLARVSTTVVRADHRVNGSAGIAASSGNSCISFKNPKVGQECKLIYRGAFVVNGTTNIASGASSSAGGTIISSNVASDVVLNEQGDFCLTIPAEKSLEWIHFSFAGSTSVRFPIIAIDEYIGNGGVVKNN